MSKATPSATAPQPARQRRALLLAALAGAIVAAAVIAAVVWYTRPGPQPPLVDLADADPDVAAAVAAARDAVLQTPRSAAAWGNLGMVLRAHDFGAEANLCFGEAARLDPKDARWPYLHGLTLLLTDLDAGIAKLQRTVALCGSEPDAPRLRLAEALLARGRLDEAEAHFRKLLVRDPDHPRARLGLGRLALFRDDPAGSLPHLRVAETSPLTRKGARLLLAEVYQRLGDDTAARDLGDVADLPDDPLWFDPYVEEVNRLQVGTQVRLAQAEALLEQGRAAEAAALLEGASTTGRDADQVWLALGRVRVQLNNLAGAEAALRNAVAARPDSVEACFQLGVAVYLRGNRAEAARWFRKAATLKPDHALAHYNLGLCMKEQGDRAAAAAEFRAALRSRPDYEQARKELDALSER